MVEIGAGLGSLTHPLAAHARQLGIRVLFYVSPQVWAWRQGRIHRIKRSVDAMAVLFPFEEALYREHGIPVRYVGNPLVDRVRKPERNLRAQLGVSKSVERCAAM